MSAVGTKNLRFSFERLPRFSSFFLIIIFSPLSAASADEIFTSTSGTTLGRSSREPKYKIEFHPAKSPFHPDDGQESIAMSNKDGQKYACFLPRMEQTKTVKSFTQQNSSSIILETDRRIKLKTPDELLDVLKDRCFYRHEGWWSYEFCHLKHLRQLHLEDDKAVQEFYLGEFDHDATTAFNQNHSDASMLKDPRSKDAAQRYHAHQYTNGTVCATMEMVRWYGWQGCGGTWDNGDRWIWVNRRRSLYAIKPSSLSLPLPYLSPPLYALKFYIFSKNPSASSQKN